MSKEGIGWCGSPAGHGSTRRRCHVAGDAKVGRSHTSIAVLIELCQCDNPAPVTVPDDPSMEALLDLDGQVLVVDPDGGHWVSFVVTRVPVSPEKPHGLDYSLTLHGPDGERLVGYDNAHRVAEQQLGDPQDHRHRLRTITAYEYRDAAALLVDFWKTVDSVLRERGFIT
jgi:hypothetical protein